MKILRWALFAGLLTLPLWDGGVRIMGYRIMLYNLYFAVLFAVSVLVLPRAGRFPLRRGMTVASLFILAISWVIANIGAEHGMIASVETLKNLQLLFFALVLNFTVRNLDDIRFYLTGLLICGTWVGAIGWAQSIWGNDVLLIRQNVQVNSQYYMGMPGAYATRVVTAFGDPIASGHFLAVIFSLALGWALGSKKLREKAWLLLPILLMALPVLTSGSRGPIIAAAITGAVMAFLFIANKRWGLLLALAIVFLALFVQDFSLPNLNSSNVFFVALERFKTGFESPRWAYWGEIFLMSLSFPFGVGLGNYPYIAPRYIPANILYIVVTPDVQIANIHAESMYFTQLIEAGWLGFLSFIGLVFSQLLYSWKLFWRSKVEANTGVGVKAGLFSAWICISVSMITVYGYNNFGIAMLFWTLVGLGLVSPKRFNPSNLVNTPQTASIVKGMI